MIISGLEGVISHVKDKFVFGGTQQEHDQRLGEVLRRLQEAGVTLNAKYIFSRRKIKFLGQIIEFLGQIIDENGMQSDPEKVKAICQMKRPQNVYNLRRFICLVNQIQKITPNAVECLRPLSELLCKGNTWLWDEKKRQSVWRNTAKNYKDSNTRYVQFGRENHTLCWCQFAWH